jgi:hypothetical protein
LTPRLPSQKISDAFDGLFYSSSLSGASRRPLVRHKTLNNFVHLPRLQPGPDLLQCLFGAGSQK